MSVINAVAQLLAAGGDYQISRSVRLRSSASGNFSRTPAAAGSRTTWTWSGWFKRGTLATQQRLFSCTNASAVQTHLSFTATSDVFTFQFANATVLVTSQVFRDPSAWYHVVLAVDTTQATAANRAKLYINGSQVTAFSTATYMAQNATSDFNNNVLHNIASFNNSTEFFDGYLTEINFIDGQALTPSSFGQTDPVTGVWQPKKYLGTYGTNGFYLNFADNSAATAAAIGKDSSGNGNNWTPNNISVTAGATYDSMLDVPTPYADGGNGRGNYCTMNPLSGDYGTFTLSNANLNFAGARTATATAYARSTIGVSSGKWYWEVSPTDVGAGPNLIVGIQDSSTTALTAGADIVLNGYGYNSSGGFKTNTSTQSAYGATYAAGDVIGIALDLDAGTIVFYKNNTSQGTAFTGITGTYCPVIVMNTGGVARTVAGSINFGQRPFTYTPPTGFKALNTQNLPDATIKNGAQYFAATLYTGNATARTIDNSVNGVSFQPDWVWIKSRSATTNNQLVDAVRGTSLGLSSNLTSAEYGVGVNAFASNGFGLTTDGSLLGVNVNAATYVAWQWNAGGSTVTNTNGSISSQVRANPTAGFSVVTYTGTGANATVGHGLGVAPKMIIVKDRSAATDWAIYHANQAASPQAGYLALDSTAAYAANAAVWNSTAPTSSVFSVGSAASLTNTSGRNYVAYLFAEVAGFSKIGTWQNNNSTDGTFVYLGFRPRFIILKNYDNVEGWFIWDSARQTYNMAPPSNNWLLPNASNAEGTNNASTAEIDGLSNGFKIRTTNPAAGEVSFGTRNYIFMAFAENPFKNALAR